ncbi:MAG: Holliday junction resolvase RuvX [Bacteroidales bacterium]|nr:Holliday junction resolvase RuvX [Bacteroidales bacterium]MDD2425157.1 Holliday junction resolvase RuvX [Bacteroidales bacterium]MDD3989596.1 Holliday junction resolvase RuvX [Bacteroidales bacterium]
MERIVGIDYGRKRTGLAVSDPLGIFASALITVPAAQVLDFLKKYSLDEKITLFVVGFPLNMNNQPSEAAADVEIFIRQLKKHFPDIPVVLEDERFTSKMALNAMIEGGVKKMKRRDKFMTDKISAAIILQTYIDREALRKKR